MRRASTQGLLFVEKVFLYYRRLSHNISVTYRQTEKQTDDNRVIDALYSISVGPASQKEELISICERHSNGKKDNSNLITNALKSLLSLHRLITLQHGSADDTVVRAMNVKYSLHTKCDLISPTTNIRCSFQVTH